MTKAFYHFFVFIMVFAQVHGDNINWMNPSTILSKEGANASDPQIAIDLNGNVIAVWIENHIVKSRTKFDNTWNEIVVLSGSDASSVKLVLDHVGNATAVWLEKGSIKTASKPLNGLWSNPIALSNSCCHSPSIMIDQEGDIVAAWVRNGNVETSTKYFESNWQPKITLNSSTAANPIVSIGGSENNRRAVIVWQGVSNGVNVIFSSMKFIKGNWNSPRIISEKEHHAAKASVAVDHNGNVLAVWYAYDRAGKNYFNGVVKSSEFSSLTGNWNVPSNLSLLGKCNPSTFKANVAFDGKGNATALWSTLENETLTLQSAVKPANSLWSDSMNVLNNSRNAFGAELSVTSLGDIVVLYMKSDRHSSIIQSIESDVSSLINHSWSTPTTLSQGSNNAYPRIALSRSGNTLHTAAVWIYNNGVNNQVASSTGFGVR